MRKPMRTPYEDILTSLGQPTPTFAPSSFEVSSPTSTARVPAGGIPAVPSPITPEVLSYLMGKNAPKLPGVPHMPEIAPMPKMVPIQPPVEASPLPRTPAEEPGQPAGAFEDLFGDIPPVPLPPETPPPPPEKPEGGGFDPALLGVAMAGLGDAFSAAAGRQSRGAESALGMIEGRRREAKADARQAELDARTKVVQGREDTEFARKQVEQKEKDDPNSPISLQYQALASRMMKGRDFSGTSAAQLERALPPIVKMYEIESEAAAKAQKTADEKQAKVIPGFETDGRVMIDEAEARKLRDGVAEFNTFKDGLRAYQAMIEKHGTTEIIDRGAQAEMAAMAKNLQLKVKNLAQLGVLSASDVPFIEKQIPEPGFFKTQSGMQGALDATEGMMKKSILSTMAARGYKPDAQMATVLAGAGGSASTAGPKPGDVEDGYRFKGGNPSDPASWEKI